MQIYKKEIKILSKELSSNKLGEMPINRLVITMAGPIILSMLVQALYNIVDSIFLGQSDPAGNTLTALTIAFPWQNIMISIAVGTGVGINALLSRFLGEKNYDAANKTASVGVLLSILSWVGMLLLTFTLINPFVDMQVSSAAQTDSEVAANIQIVADYTKQYLYIVSGASIGVFLQVCFERLLQATGKTVLSMLIQLIGALINIILDPVFIFTFKMGVAGAALATVIGQIAASLIGFILNRFCNKDIHLSFKEMKPQKEIISRIYKIAIPSVVMSSIGSVMTTGINMILMAIKNGGTIATTIFGLYFKIISFINMPVFGINNGIVPIISYNYGAKNKDRIISTFKISIIYATVIMIVGLIIFQSVPDKLIMLFSDNSELISQGITALRITSIPFVIVGFCIVSIGCFQALDLPNYSLIISVARQLLVLLPVAYLFSLTGNPENVWWAFPIAEVMSFLFCIFFALRVYKTKLKNL